MQNNLIGLGKQAQDAFSQEEAAAVKAQIVIKKGGKFTDSEERTGDLGSMLSDIGFSTDDMQDLMEEHKALMSATGLEAENFTGYQDNEVIKVQMNPNSYTIKSKTNFITQNMGGLKPDNATFGIFTPPEPRVLSVKLYYDTMLQADYLDKLKEAGSSVLKSLSGAKDFMSAGMGLMKAYQKFNGKEDLQKLYLEKILCLTRVLNQINTPPLISFEYGSISFEGYVKDVTVDYKRFNKMGEVVRAEVSLSIEESNSYGDKEKTSGSKEAKKPEIGSSSKALPNLPI